MGEAPVKEEEKKQAHISESFQSETHLDLYQQASVKIGERVTELSAKER